MRVAVESQHALVRIGLAQMLGDSALVALSSRDCDRDEHDVVIYDLVAGMTDVSRDGLQHLLGRGHAVVVLEPGGAASLAKQAIALGAADAVPISVTAPFLVAALQNAACGRGTTLEQYRAQRLAQLRGETGLSVRELEILEAIGSARRNDEIAQELYLTINSVKSYIRTAYRKIGVKTRSQAVLWAVQHGLT